MVTSELAEYVKNERARGVNDDDLRRVLQESGGWALVDIEEVLRMSKPSAIERAVEETIHMTDAASDVARAQHPKIAKKGLTPLRAFGLSILSAVLGFGSCFGAFSQCFMSDCGFLGDLLWALFIGFYGGAAALLIYSIILAIVNSRKKE